MSTSAEGEKEKECWGENEDEVEESRVCTNYSNESPLRHMRPRLTVYTTTYACICTHIFT